MSFINGIGLITSSGCTVQENWEKMLQGINSIHKIERINTEGLKSKNAAQIALDDETLLKLVEQKHIIKSKKNLPLERSEILMMIAFCEALKDAEISESELKSLKVGVYIGTSLSGFTRLENDYREHYRTGKYISVKSLLSYPLHTCADRLFYEYDLIGDKVVFSTACSASLHPFLVAHEMLNRSKIDIAVIVGCDSLSLMSLAGFSSLKSLAEEYCTPFSVGDFGITIGEGAGVVILSNKEGKYPSLLGVCGTSDAYHPTASNPTGESIRKCIENVLVNVDVANKKIAIMSHGTGTHHNDMVEMRALNSINLLKNSSVMATKSFIGHTLGASGAIETVLLTKCIQEKTLLPIANYTSSRQDGSLHCVQKKEPVDSEILGVKSSFAFGGNNVSVLIGDNSNLNTITSSIEEDDIVISGVGVVSPFDVYSNEDFLELVKNKKKSYKKINRVNSFSERHFAEYAGIVDEIILNEMCIKLRLKNTRKMDKLSKMTCVACGLAIKDAGLKINSDNTDRVSLITSSGSGQMTSVSEFYDNILENGNSVADANIFPNTVVNAHAGYATIEYRIKGYSTVIAQGESGAYSAIKLAKILLESNRADVVIVGAVNEYSENYHRALLDLRYSDNFDTQNFLINNGTCNILSEGAVFFVVERNSNLLKRGGIPRAYIPYVDLVATPCVPSTYQIRINPLKKIFEKISKTIRPDYLAGDGNANLQHKKLEFDAVKEFFPDIPFSSLGYNMGFMCGIIPFFNLAFFVCNNDRNNIPVGNNSQNDIGIRLLSDKDKRSSVLIESLIPGGTAGIIYAKKYE